MLDFFIITFLFIIEVKAQKTITVKNNGTVSFLIDCNTVQAAFQNKNTIYLWENTFVAGSLIHDKKIIIIGVSHDLVQVHESLFSHLNRNFFCLEAINGSRLYSLWSRTLHFHSYNNENQNFKSITHSKTSSINPNFINSTPTHGILFAENVITDRTHEWGARQTGLCKNFLVNPKSGLSGNASI